MCESLCVCVCVCVKSGGYNDLMLYHMTVLQVKPVVSFIDTIR